MSLTSKETLDKFIETVDWGDTVIEESVDGTLINIFYNDNKWNISTKGTIDADCRWNSYKTFKELFIEACKIEKLNYDLLKQNYCYSFVLCHPNCRNVTVYEKPRLIHVSSRNIDTLVETDEEIGIDKPSLLKLDKYNITNCQSYDDLIQQVDTLLYDNEGFMLYNKNRSLRTKLIGKNFTYVKNLKGGYPLMDLRLMELRTSIKSVEFFKYFPEYLDQAKNIEKKINAIAKKILELYIKIKVNNDYIELPRILKTPIYKIHEIYLNKRTEYTKLAQKYAKKPLINISIISKWLNDCDPKYLCYLLNNY